DDRYEERPDRPAWAAVPTMPWSRVQPAERRDTGSAPGAPRERSDQGAADNRPWTEEEDTYRSRRAAPEATEEPKAGRPGGYEPDLVGDPEAALAAARIGYDPATLHEQPENVYELYRIRDSLTSKIDTAADNASRARLLGLRAVVGRMVGDLRPA